MDRNREARRATSIVGSNGFNKRRHRTNSLRDSPDEDGGIELQESARLRERVKKDRDRERERERERERDLRERERERDLRERSSRSSSKRRRAEILATNRDDIGGDETTDESFNEDDDEEDEHTATAVRSFPPPPTAAAGSISSHHHHHQNHSFSTSFSQQHSSSSGNIMSSNNNHLQHRKSFPLSSSSAKVLRAPPVWKSGDEMISASVPRKARSASTKRLHDWISSSSNNNSSGGGVEQNPGQVSDSPAGHTPVSASPPLQIPAAAAAPLSPSSSNASARKKLKTSITNPGQKLKPPQKVSSSSKPSSSNPEELEIEIAEVLYGLMTQSQGPSSSSKKEDSREANRLNSEANNSSPLSAVAPKRKRPRQIPENSVYRDAVPAKPMAEQMPKIEILSPNLEKISGSGGGIGYEMGGNSVISQVELPVKSASESTKVDLELNSVVEESRENRDLVAKEEVTSPKEKESPALRTENSSNMDLQSTTVIKENLVSQMENRKEEKFEIDLMAPPPQVRSSPERENKIASKASTVDPKPISSIDDAVSASKNKEDEKGSTNVAAEEKKGTGLIEEAESHKEIENKGRNIDLHLDLEKHDRDGCAGINSTVNKSQPQIHKQMPFKPTKEEPPTDKSGHVTSSLPLPLPMPMSVANWPGGLPPMGYMAPLQGVVSMDGSGVTPSHMQPLFSQPRPKRCATHCHIARNIHCLQQFMKMNPFWPGPTPPPSSLFGSTRPLAQDPNANVTVRGGNNNNPDNKAHSPNHSGKDKNSQPNINSDSSQRKQQQILIQQPLPPSVSPTNLLGPTFIFPLNHQQQQAAAARPSSAKSPAASSASSAAAATSVAAAAAAAAMSYNYPNMAPANETQYVAIMQNNGYPFPMPAVGPPPNYRGPAMPLFNGSFYSPQMIHPSQLLQQNASAPSNSLSSQKHLQSQQQQQQQNPSSNKTPPPQQYAQHQTRPRHHLEGDQDNNSSPSTNDSTTRGYRPPMSMYGQNFAMMHPQNFAMMTHPPPPQNEKKGAHQGSKGGGESLPQHSFAMSFGPVNGSSGGDMMTSSMAQNQTMFQNSAQNMMISSMAAHKKSFRISDDGKSGSADSSGKTALGGGGGGGGQSIAFTRADSPVNSSIQANNSVIESSARSLNNASSSAHSSRAVAATNVVGPTSVQNAHIAQLHHHQQQQQQQLQHLQQQQMMQFKQQHHQLAASRSKVVPPPANHTAGSNNNNNIYSDQLNLSSSTMAAKFQNAQNLVHSNTSSNGGAQSPQWRSSTTKTPSSLAAPPPTTTAATTLKNIPQHQQHSRNQPQLMHTQISFSGGGSNQKPPSASPQGGQAPPPPSSPMMVGGSPTTSSVSKGGPGGSPRTTSSASTSNKTGQGSSYSVQSIMPNQRSPSILGNPNVTSSSSSAPKAQMPKTMQQTQMFFSNMYSQSQPPHSTGNSPNTSGPGPYYTQRRRQDQLTPGGAPAAVGPTSANTNDPAMAIAAATKGGGGGLPSSQGVMHAMLPAGFSYVHPVPAAVQAKPSEQKQTAGNDNLHQWQPEKK